MGEVINISDYTEKAIEQTIEQLLQETTDVQQLLERLGSLSETQKRKILQILSNRIQSKKQAGVSEEFSFDELDSELMRYAHQDRSQRNKDNKKLQKQRRNAMLKRLRKFFSVNPGKKFQRFYRKEGFKTTTGKSSPAVKYLSIC